LLRLPACAGHRCRARREITGESAADLSGQSSAQRARLVAERSFHSFQLPCIGKIASRTRRHTQT
jgi:hypothetical protein